MMNYKNNANQYLIASLLEKILSLASNPGECGEYITRQIRELVGVKIVALMQAPIISDSRRYSIVSVCPERHRNTVMHPEINVLCTLSQEAASLIELSLDDGDRRGRQALAVLGFQETIIIPLKAGGEHVGSLLLLDLLSTDGIEGAIDALKSISGVIGLIFKNSILFQNLDALVAERTHELEKEIYKRELKEEMLRVSEKKLYSNVYNLGERIKELNCLYNLSKLTETEGITLKEILQGSIDLCPPSWQYPEITCAQIIYSDKLYKTDNFRKSEWSQSREIIVYGEIVGIIEIYYLEEKPAIDEGPFLKEERDLLDSIAERIGRTIERKQTEAEKEKLKAHLLQAQKMESVGRLAGGVAHDYNNALSVIIGFTELVIEKMDPLEPLQADLNEILKAAMRATEITRQLLAFARKQVIAPKIVDLNENIKNMLKMLRHLIGEDIDLAWLPEENLWPVKIDPTQVDQILANLCVNARDAIEGVGKITIETGNAIFDEPYCNNHPGFIPGEFVLIAISDNGYGMDKETLDNIFDPFFTTKEIGKGTGLGLAMVYGIIKQNNGFINVYSETGEGTTIKIYLSRHKGNAFEMQRAGAVKIPPGQKETVLLVEDDLSLLELTERILCSLDYNVLPANSPEKALELVKKHGSRIQLLVTDVIMPQMNGRDLRQQLQSTHPDLKTLFMSGYTSNVIAHHGVLDEGVHFIQKPFSKKDLAVMVRKVLD